MSTTNVLKNENYNKLNEIKNRVDNSYLFLNLSAKQTTSLFQTAFNEILKQDRIINSSFLNKLEKMYNLEYKKIIKDKILNDTTRKFLQNYVNYLLLNYKNNSYEKLLSFSKELDKSLTYLSTDDYKYLINNTILKDLIKDCIDENKIDLLLNTSLYSLIVLYSTLANIDILKEQDNFIDEYFYEEDVDLSQTDQLRAYFDMIPKKILTAEEEKYYFEQVSLGSKEAKEYLIKHNLKLVISIAKKHQNRGLELADLIQEGNIGLMHAIDTFDVNKGPRLFSYASVLIHNAIRKAINNYGRTIKIPITLKEKIINLYETRTNLNNTLGRQATTEELAHALGITVKKVENIIEASKNVISYNIRIEDSENNDELIDLVRDNIDIEEDFIKANFQENILKILELLNEKERYILIHHFGLNNEEEKTLEQIGKDLNINGERVRQIEKATLKKLANEQKVRNNVDYLDKVIDFSKEEQKLYIYNYFKDSRYLFNAFSYLEESEVNYLKNIFGEYFDKKASIIDTEEFKDLINKLNIIMEALKNPSNSIISYSTLDKILGINSLEEILYLIEKLNINDQNVLARKYPNGFDNLPNKLAYPFEMYILKGIIKKMKFHKETENNKVLLKEKKN